KAFGGENHLSLQPIPETRFTFAKHGAGRSWVSYLALHPMGFSVPRRLRFARCALTAPFHHHLDIVADIGAVCFLWHCPLENLSIFHPRVSPTKSGLRGIAPGGVRTFLFRRTGSDSPPFQNQLNYKVTGGGWQVTRRRGSVLNWFPLPAQTGRGSG